MLGHELGHAHMALHSPTTHRLCLFVQHYIFRASGEQVQDWWHLPHEAACDGFGRFVAESAVSAERVKGDLSLLMASPELPIEAIRLKTMLENDSMPQVPDVLPALRELARPFEAPLRRAWLDEEAKGADFPCRRSPPRSVVRLGIPVARSRILHAHEQREMQAQRRERSLME